MRAMSDARHPSSIRWLAHAPLLPPAAGLIAGVVLDDRLRSHFGVNAGIFMLGLAAAWIGRKWVVSAVVGVVIASVAAGALLHAARVRHQPPESIAHHLADDPMLVRLSGTVSSPPRVLPQDDSSLFAPWYYHGERTAFLLDLHAAEGLNGNFPAEGRIRVTIQEAMLDLREGEQVEVFGRLSRLRGAQNPGSFDWSRFYQRQGIVAALRADHRQCVRRLDRPSVAPPPKLLDRFRAQVRGWLIDDLATGSDEDGSLLAAMVLGHRSTLDRQLNAMFIDSGCMHFLAVSGTHVVMLMVPVWMIGRLLRLPRRWSAWGVAVLLILYALVTEPQPPILRATIIGVLYCLSVILLRGHAHLNWLSAAAILLLMADPAGVFDIGFQLSFVAVLGVAYVAPSMLTAARAFRARITRRGAAFALRNPPHLLRENPTLSERLAFAVRWGGGRLLAALGVTLAVSFGAWLMGLPIALFHFHRVQPWGAVNSVLVLPLITLVTVLGALKVVVAGISPTLSVVLGSVIQVCSDGLLWLVAILARMPGGSWFGPSPSAWWIVVFYAAVAAFVRVFPPAWHATRIWHQEKEEEIRPRNRAAYAFAWTMLGLLTVTTFVLYGPRRATGRLEVTALAVGAGSATVVELPDGRAMLFDAGSSSYPDVGRSTILPYLWERGIRQLDTVFISHANLDHYNGLPDILAEIPTKRVVLTPYFLRDATDKSPPRRLLDWLEENKVPWSQQTANALQIAPDVALDCYWPPLELDETWESNETSLVIEIGLGGKSVLLTGDVETRAQAAMLDHSSISADVLFLPHHGGMSDVLNAFVRRVQATTLIRSSREPMHETMTGLREIAGDVPLYNTADVGAIILRIEKDGSMVVETPCGRKNSSGK